MNRLILNLLNAPLLLLIALIGIAIQSALFAIYPLHYFQPDFVLLIIIWVALKRKFTEGGILVLILGMMVELHSAAPQGLYMLSYMIIFLIVNLAERYIVLPHITSLALLAMSQLVLLKASQLITLSLLGSPLHSWRYTVALLFPGAVVEGLIALWVFKFLNKFDWLTFKNNRVQVLEDELELEGEGL